MTEFLKDVAEDPIKPVILKFIATNDDPNNAKQNYVKVLSVIEDNGMEIEESNNLVMNQICPDRFRRVQETIFNSIRPTLNYRDMMG